MLCLTLHKVLEEMVYYFGAILVSVLLMALAIVLARWLVVGRMVREKRSNRGLFRFNDGVRIRSVDPIEVLIALEAHSEFRFDLHPLRASNGESEAFGVIADAVRSAFGVPAFTSPGQPGLTVRECYELYSVFVRYVTLQKKSTEPTPISASDTVQTSKPSEPSATNDTLASGSIATAL